MFTDSLKINNNKTIHTKLRFNYVSSLFQNQVVKSVRGLSIVCAFSKDKLN